VADLERGGRLERVKPTFLSETPCRATVEFALSAVKLKKGKGS
jgi:hypothetical protein